MDIVVTSWLTIAGHEVSFEFARSPGPGGQHVNKTSTAVTLCFDVGRSRNLAPRHKHVVRCQLRTRISKSGILRVRSRRFRSQAANRRAAIERFAELLAEALTPQKPRVKTRMPRGAKQRRLEQKRKRSRVKEMRKPPQG